MAATLIIVAVSGAIWLLTIIWRRVISVPKVKLPYHCFEGDNSAERHLTESAQLLAEGYEKVCPCRNRSASSV